MSAASQRKPHLRRLEQVFTHSPIYFVTTCSENRKPLLASERVRGAFTDFALRASDYGAWVGGYVLMPDHLHLFAAFGPGSVTLSGWMRALKRTLATVGVGWQKGFFDHVLRSRESYNQKWAYVRQNPVRAGLVGKSGDWPYQGEIHRLDSAAWL